MPTFGDEIRSGSDFAETLTKRIGSGRISDEGPARNPPEFLLSVEEREQHAGLLCCGICMLDKHDIGRWRIDLPFGDATSSLVS